MMKLLVGLATILTFAQSAFAGNTAAITYTDAASVQQIRVFARGFNQHLVVDAWDGRWQWYDLGNPLTYYSMSPDLSAITYMDAAGTQQIRVFGTVNDYSFGPYHSLIVANWDGTGWTWSDLGLPPGVSSFRRGDKLNAIEYVDDFGNQQIRVFATGDNSHLIVAAWDGSWNWYDLGVPPGTPGVYNPDAIVYTDAGEPQHLRVFVNGSDGQLYTDAWDGTSWQWFNLGSPAPTYFTPVAITYRDDESRQIRVFAGGSDGHVYTAAWDGSWSWYDLGFPPSGFSTPNAIVYADSYGTQIRVFAGGNEGDLWALDWSAGTGWFYEDRGIPYGGTLSSIHDQSAITWEDDERVRHIRVFALFDSQLVTDAWDGFGWAWYLLGFPL